MEFSSWTLSVFIPLICFLLNTSGEILTNVDNLEKLLLMRGTYIQSLEDYINIQESYLRMLKSHVIRYKVEQKKSVKNTFEYLSNPLNTYLLVKQLTRERGLIEAILKNNETLNEVLISSAAISEELNDDDFKIVVKIISELQDTFNLKAEALANGEINNVKCDKRLSCDDCFTLGFEFFNLQDYYHAVQWLNVALKRKEIEGNSTAVETEEILDFLSTTLYNLGNLEMAHYFASQLLIFEPDNLEVQNLKQFCKDTLEEKLRYKSKKSNVHEAKNSIRNEFSENPEIILKPKSRSIYEMLCNNDIERPIDVTSKLTCSYLQHNPFLQIAPIKMEQINLNPPIVLFYDIIYENEIETIEIISLPRLQRAGVVNNSDSQTVYQPYRVGKMVFLEDSIHSTVAAVRRRVSDITGLTTETAENFQVVNYGIGGHYYAHYDHFSDEVIYSNYENGNRIATFLLYLNDVVQGGGTVFPQLNITVQPIRGSAVFWYNLFSSGDPDPNSLHAACPVLQGTKWISTIWFRERGQEFLRPCNPTDAIFASY